MSSRYPPSHDARYRRDRSPPRYLERRSSSTYGVGSGSRHGETSFRASGYDGYEGSHYHPSDREVPRGPKALLDSSRGGRPTFGPPHVSSIPVGPRGRASNFRDASEPRDQPPLSAGRDRDAERSWRKHEYERIGRRVSPLPRTPPTEYRDFRDHPPLRDLDVGRIRRDSRDGPVFGSPDFSTRGGFARAGRRRGADRAYRGRVSGSQVDEKDTFRQRSRSREREWERTFHRDDGERERGRIAENRIDPRLERKEEENRIQREERSREALLYKRDQAPTRAESKYPSGPSTAPSTPHAPSVSTPCQPGVDRNTSLKEFGSDQRTSNSAPGIVRDAGKSAQGDRVGSRVEASRERYAPRPSSPPPQAPQVPAFGSFAYNPSQAVQYTSATSNVWRAPENRPAQQSSLKLVSSQGPKVPPSAPKAQLTSQPPTAPRADRVHEQAPAAASKEPHSNVSKGPPAGLGNGVGGQIQSPTLVRPDAVPESIPNATQKQTVEVQDKAGGPSKSTPLSPSSSTTGYKLLSGTTKPLVPPTGPQTGPRTLLPAPSQPLVRQSAKAILSNRPVSPPVTAPLGPRVTAPFNTSPKAPIIPTGPKADRTVPIQPRTSGPPYAGKNLQWIRPGLPTQANKLQAPPVRKDVAEEGKVIVLTGGTDANRGGLSAPFTETPSASPRLPTEFPEKGSLPKSQSGLRVEARSAVPPGALTDGLRPLESGLGEERIQPSRSSTQSNSSSSDGEEDLLAFDEADLVEHEAKFTRDKARLESQKVHLGLRQLRAVPLLLELEQLVVLAKCEILSQARSKEGLTVSARLSIEEAPVELLTPKAEEMDESVLADARIFREPSFISEDSPEVDSLPYLNHGILTPLSDLETFQDNLALHETCRVALQDAFERQWEVEQDGENQRRRLFAKLYSDWRREVKELDAQPKEEETEKRQPSMELDPSIPSQEVPPALPSAFSDGSRRHRWGTEHDLQLAIQISLEEQEQMQNMRRQETNKQAIPDVTKEAVIPNMYDHFERSARVFKDTNGLLDPDDAFDHFELVPPKDDFTSEEHRILVQNFREYPKKWGKIAQALPGRNYKQCINHYYATKWDKEYKPPRDRRKAKGPRARIVKGIGGQGRAKTGALMANLGVRPDVYDGDEFAQPIVTVPDTRRPKRAAAPTFGEKESEAEQATPAATPGKKNISSSKAEHSGDATIDKPKRQRLLNREKSQRRTKHQPLAAAPSVPSLLMHPDIIEGTGNFKSEVESKGQELEDARLLANLHTVINSKIVDRQAPYSEGGNQQAHSMPSPETHRPHAQQGPTQSRGGAAGGPTSYWSRPEQTDFPKFLAHFGTDWSAISNHMGSKTQTMVKNYYNRLIDQGRSDIEEAANDANARRLRGDDVGPPPTPSFVPAKRPDPGQTVTTRSLAPSSDVEEVNTSLGTLSHDVPHASPGQYIQPHRYATISQAAKPSELSFTLSSAQQAAAFEPPPPQPQTRTPQQSHGPRLGIFTDNRFDPRRILQAAPPVDSHHASSAHDRHRLSDPQLLQTTDSQDRLGRPRSVFTEQDQTDSHTMQHLALHTAAAAIGAAAKPREVPAQLNAVQARLDSSRDNTDSLRQGLSGLRHLIDPSPQASTSLSVMPNPTGNRQTSASHHEDVRPSSLPAPPPVDPAPRRQQEPPRRSNIMAILNSEPEEPKPARRLDEHMSSLLNRGGGAVAAEYYLRQPPPLHRPSTSTPQQVERGLFPGAPLTQPTGSRTTDSGPRHAPEAVYREALNPSGSRSDWPLRMGMFHNAESSAQLSQSSLGRGLESRLLQEQGPGSIQALEVQARNVSSPPPQPAYDHSRGRSFTQTHNHGQPNVHLATAQSHSQAELRAPTTQHQAQQVLHPNPYAQVMPPSAGPSHTQSRQPVREGIMNPERPRPQLEMRIEQGRRDPYFSQAHTPHQYSNNHAMEPATFQPLAHPHQHHHHHRHHHHHHHPSRENLGNLPPRHQPNSEPVIDVVMQRGQHDYHDPRRAHVEDISFPRQVHDQDRRQLLEAPLYRQTRIEMEEYEHRLAVQREEDLRRQHQHQQQQAQSMYGRSRTPTAGGLYQPPQGR